jgi:hypothetical protein
MKKNIIATILTSFFFVLSFVVTAQTNPPNPGGVPVPGQGSNTPPPMGGGSAPVGGGTLILLGLGIAYGTKKTLKVLKENHEELES